MVMIRPKNKYEYPIIVVRSLKYIQSGEEICCDYGKDYTVTKCLCKSLNCRGYIGIRPCTLETTSKLHINLELRPMKKNNNLQHVIPDRLLTTCQKKLSYNDYKRMIYDPMYTLHQYYIVGVNKDDIKNLHELNEKCAKLQHVICCQLNEPSKLLILVPSETTFKAFVSIKFDMELRLKIIDKSKPIYLGIGSKICFINSNHVNKRGVINDIKYEVTRNKYKPKFQVRYDCIVEVIETKHITDVLSNV